MKTQTADATTERGQAKQDKHEFHGREVELPVVVRKATSATATYIVGSAAAQALIPGEHFEVAEVLPGRTLLALACIDYIDNDLGNYNEVSMTLFVRERGRQPRLPYISTWRDFLRGRLGTYIHRLPVNQSFTCAAGCGIWGFPKSVETIDITETAGASSCRLEMQGEHVLTLSIARGGRTTIPEAQMATYTYIEGVPHKTVFASGARGCGFHLGGAKLELGSHAVADELRSLGLPKKALMTMWMQHMHGRFEAPQML